MPNLIEVGRDSDLLAVATWLQCAHQSDLCTGHSITAQSACSQPCASRAQLLSGLLPAAGRGRAAHSQEAGQDTRPGAAAVGPAAWHHRHPPQQERAAPEGVPPCLCCLAGQPAAALPAVAWSSSMCVLKACVEAQEILEIADFELQDEDFKALSGIKDQIKVRTALWW